MKRSTIWVGGSALVLISMALNVSPVAAQIPYYYNPTAGMAPGPSRTASKSPPSSTSTSRSNPASNSVGVVAGEIVPFILQNDFLSSLPVVRAWTPPINSAQVWLHVPPGAQVWFNGAGTTQGGDDRHYTSPPLTPGRQYSYQVRVRWMKAGKAVEEERNLKVQAGASVRSDFTSLPGSNRSSALRP